MTLSDRTLPLELSIRKLTKKLIIDDTTTCYNKSVTKHTAIGRRQKQEKTKANSDRYGINHFNIKEKPNMGKKMMELVISNQE